MKYFAGIDGGQSTTRAVIGDETGHVLAHGAAGPADEITQDPKSTRLRDALSCALSDARTQAGLLPEVTFEQIVAGISGYEGRVYGVAPALPTSSLTLTHDAPIAHAGALAGKPGVVVIVGTGSVAYALSERGDTATCGGWGYLFGDEGSAFWLACESLADAMRSSDAGDPAAITQLALQAFNVSSLRELARAFYTGAISRVQIAGFAQTVTECAEKGDERAAAFIGQGAVALVTLAMRAMDAAGMQNAPVAFTGGLLKSSTVSEQISQTMRRMLPSSPHIPPAYDPACGALLLAYRAAGLHVETLHE